MHHDDQSQGLTSIGAILVEKLAPERVGPDSPFEYEVQLTNVADRTVPNVILVETVLSVLSIEDSHPPSQVSERHTGRWLLGPIHPKKTVTVRISCSARKRLRFRSHTSISYSQES